MLYQKLLQKKQSTSPIRIGCSGAGWLGSGFVAQVRHVPGMEVSILADPDDELRCQRHRLRSHAARHGQPGRKH